LKRISYEQWTNALQQKQLNRVEAARFKYRLRRYLSGATEDELTRRLDDIAVNLYTFTSNGKIGLYQHTAEYWVEKLEHLIVENEVRGRDILNGSKLEDSIFSKNILDKFRAQPHILKITTVPGWFYRFGRLNHMQALRTNGEIFLQPASYYGSQSLDSARRDDELNFRSYVCPNDYDLNVVDPFLKKILPERCYQYLDQQKPSDYYLFCVSARFEMRLFADFKADACLMITDQSKFISRLTESVKSHFPGWLINFGNARYVDPYNMPMRFPGQMVEFPFYKHHRYLYQSELRLVALPLRGVVQIEPRKLSIGSLADISELIALNGAPFCLP
jgi:hypothetical protein